MPRQTLPRPGARICVVCTVFSLAAGLLPLNSFNEANEAADESAMDPFGRTFNRLLAVFGLSIVFVATASIISPRTSAAGLAGSSSTSEGQIIGRLIGAEREVVVFASAAGPRYSVYDLDGVPLAVNLTIEQLGRRFEGLDATVSGMMQSGGRMGLVDEIDQRPGSDQR